MKQFLKHLIVGLAALLLFTSCSGGGAGGGGGNVIVVAAYVVDNTTGIKTTEVSITDDSFSVIDDATVTINGTTVPHQISFLTNIYSTTSVDLSAGETANMKVVIDGTTYLNETVTVPAAVNITAPTDGATYDEATSLNVTWTGPSDVDQYSISIEDDGFGGIVASGDDYLGTESGGATSHTIPADTLVNGYSFADIQVSAENIAMVNSSTFAMAASVDKVSISE